jgi:hypothetical protein
MGVLLTERSEADKRRGAFPDGTNPVFSWRTPEEEPMLFSGMAHPHASGRFYRRGDRLVRLEPLVRSWGFSATGKWTRHPDCQVFD